jgi:hypothetical protein
MNAPIGAGLFVMVYWHALYFLSIKSLDMNKSEKRNSTRLLLRFARSAVGICILLSGHSILQAQSAVSASGGNGTGSGGSVSYTIGQVNYTNFSGEGGSVSLGVQQPNLFLNVGIHEADITLSASVFPNPANSSTSLRLEGENTSAVEDGLTYNLYDINGKLLQQQDIQSSLTTIPMDKFAEGVYILQVTRRNVEIKSFKIFKTN